ncbi:MAG TPA: TlpA disulfide reductase family protein [Actinomycetota bacterium]|nr:TlpA disulfide reductase family protein [Actinomycetota bacterium]
MDSPGSSLRIAVWVTVVLGLATTCAEAPPQRRTTAPACPRVIPPEGLNAPLLPRTTCSLPEFDPARFRVLLGQLRGVPVVVNIWGSWCGPCLEEAPDLARVARELEGRVQFIGVDINDLRVPAQNFIRRFGWPYPSVFDQPGAIRDALGLVGQPHTVVFDASGTRTLVHPGAITARQLRAELRRLLR